MAGIIDPTVAANYPVILGDGLLGKTSEEIFTGIYYNHRPALSTVAPPEHARLKPALPGSTKSFDLSYSDDSGKYAYAGTRNTNSNQYVLYFDPAREAFILDRIDSTFDMNLTRLPDNSDPDQLSRKYPQIGSQPKSTKETKLAPDTRKIASRPQKDSPMMQPKKSHEKKAPKPEKLSLPKPAKPKPVKPKPKSKTSDLGLNLHDDDEEEEGEDALLIEYPDAAPKKNSKDFSPAFPSVRRFDEFMDARESEGDDADGESEDEPDDLRLPSPLNRQDKQQDDHQEQRDSAEDAMDVDVDEPEQDEFADLEKDMENAFEDIENTFEDVNYSNQATPQVADAHRDHDESEISEED